MKENKADIKVAVIGLGYVGLPVAVAFARRYKTVGFDNNAARIEELEKGIDRTGELEAEELEAAVNLDFSSDAGAINSADVYIVTVPTPIDSHKKPDLSCLESASETVGGALEPGNVVVYESTVFPGCTEEVCVPILEAESGLVFNRDFHCGYSPERINPGDRSHRLSDIKKVVSGSTPDATAFVEKIYAPIIGAGIYSAPSIKVAEAAKVIENAQRDLNIAFINELSMLFEKIGIDTLEVLKAAGTKWNFLPFRPGLVGGHCIGVDPYYLTHKAQEVGHHPEIILAGRRINDSMGRVVAGRVIKLMIKKKKTIAGARVLVVGITFKENCPDVRNSRVIDIVEELGSFECNVDVFDPLACVDEVKANFGIDLISASEDIPQAVYDACVLAVPHEAVEDFDIDARLGENAVIYDVKGALDQCRADGRL